MNPFGKLFSMFPGNKQNKNNWHPLANMIPGFNNMDQWMNGFSQNPNGNTSNGGENQLDQYIQSTVQDMMNNNWRNEQNEDSEQQARGSASFSYRFVELHDYYIIRFDLREHENGKDIKLFQTPGKIQLRHEQGREQTVKLPGDSSEQQLRAKLRDGILEVLVPKRNEDFSKEIPVHF
ncbi:MAG: hypothetical protein ACRCWQ_08570 [Bacilli bacterium]